MALTRRHTYDESPTLRTSIVSTKQLVMFAIGTTVPLAVVCFAFSLQVIMGDSNDRSRDDSPILLQLYYETHCKYSRQFIVEQLYPTYQKVGNIMEIEMVPYGNAQTQVMKKNDTLWFVFKCQHHEKECIGNQIQTCAIKLYDKTEAHLPFIYCMENSNKTEKMGEECANQQGLDWDRIDRCTRSWEGGNWQRDMAIKTKGTNPKKTYVPWLVFDGEHTEDLNKAGREDLLKVICDRYGGDKPKACP